MNNEINTLFEWVNIALYYNQICNYYMYVNIQYFRNIIVHLKVN